MIDLAVAIPGSVAGFAALLWLLSSRKKSQEERQFPAGPSLELPLPKHYRYLPQVRQALCAYDEQFLRRHCSRAVAHRAIRERRAVAKKFLQGLRQDFQALEHFAKTIAALSPKLSREQETERLMLSLRFKALYGMAWLQVATGNNPLRPIEQLTNVVGTLAARVEEAMAVVAPLQPA